jgi:hypothetical protein
VTFPRLVPTDSKCARGCNISRRVQFRERHSIQGEDLSFLPPGSEKESMPFACHDPQLSLAGGRTLVSSAIAIRQTVRPNVAYCEKQAIASLYRGLSTFARSAQFEEIGPRTFSGLQSRADTPGGLSRQTGNFNG